MNYTVLLIITNVALLQNVAGSFSHLTMQTFVTEPLASYHQQFQSL